MRADIALGQRAVDGIGDGMEPHIGIGMALQAPLMGQGHAAEHHVIAGPEAVHVVAIAGADIHASLHQPFGACEIAAPW